MIYEYLIVLVIEIFTINLFISYYFRIKNIRKFIILCSVCILEILILNSNPFNYLLIFLLTITWILYLNSEFKYIYFSSVWLPIILITTLLFSNSLIIVFALNTLPPLIRMTVTISFFTFSCLTLLTLLKIANTVSITFIDYIITTILMFTTYTFLTSVIDAIINHHISYRLIYHSIVEITYFLIYYYVNKQKKLNRNLMITIEKNKNQYKLFYKINNIAEKIKRDKHMMLYSLINIETLLSLKKEKELSIFLKKEINKLLNYNFLSSTNNPIFDYNLTVTINHLIAKGFDIKTILILDEQNAILDDRSFVLLLMNFIRIIIEEQSYKDNIEIVFKTVNDHILFKIVILNGKLKENSPSVKQLFSKKNVINHTVKYEENYLILSILIKALHTKKK